MDDDTQQPRRRRPRGSGRILDDRGRPTIVLDHGFNTEAPSKLVAQIQSVVAYRTQPFRLDDEITGVWPVLMIVLLMVQTPLAAGFQTIGVPAWVAPVPSLCLIVALGWGWRRAARTQLAGSIRDACLSQACCASCGYSLAGLSSESDGCTVCPECAAAWKMPEKAAPLPSAPKAPRSPLAEFWSGFGGENQSVIDARGRIVQLIDPSVRRSPPTQWSSLDDRLKDRIDADLFGLSLRGRLFMLLVGSLMAWGGWRQLAKGPLLTAAGIGHALLGATLLGLGLLAAVHSIFRRSAPRPRSLIRLMLRHGVCPSCAAVLNTQTDPIVCGACGAAWATPR